MKNALLKLKAIVQLIAKNEEAIFINSGESFTLGHISMNNFVSGWTTIYCHAAEKQSAVFLL